MQDNFGVGIADAIASVWTHGGNVIDSIGINEYLDRLREEV